LKIENMDDLLSELHNVRLQLRELQEQEKALKSTKNELEARIVTNLENQGIEQVANDKATVSIKKEIVPTVENWDAFQAYIAETGMFELMQKRASATAYRELQQMGQEVPGVRATELTRVNFRSK
jgi:predicted transcriptional regulator